MVGWLIQDPLQVWLKVEWNPILLCFTKNSSSNSGYWLAKCESLNSYIIQINLGRKIRTWLVELSVKIIIPLSNQVMSSWISQKISTQWLSSRFKIWMHEPRKLRIRQKTHYKIEIMSNLNKPYLRRGVLTPKKKNINKSF